ncbi:copper amine oxidase domain protein [Desulforamulus reducens MI-1]|uniref:Copper amine oxidase domain protein n=1 Tax=Desulforamulus reducens (strain ATCC BAA-1160 / DSM 100696 / MI-1) TaxID=349161 RepID=A4J992_DESRM|nr:stalk domain-containing protein [Desulforamulus reducens]ABO51645.1 copper amine oxidase domain protein [Desulforamulus reducens MI-1]
MKKTKLWLLILATLMLFALPAYADTKVTVEGKEYSLQAVTYQGHILIPLRDTSNLLGAKVNYLADVGIAYIEKNETQLRIHMGDALSYLNNKIVSSGVSPVVIEGKAYVPLRFLAESLNYNVTYAEDKIQLTGKPLAKVHFIDVGFGDAIFIQLLNDKNILIDAGDKKGGGTVATYLRNQGVKEIDLVVSSTVSQEHMEGLATIFQSFKVKKVIDTYTASNDNYYERFKEELTKRNISYEPANKQVLALSGVTFEILSSYGQMINADRPSKTIVSSLKVGDQSFLFMSDRTGQTEMSDIPAQKYIVLKIADHGGIYSTSKELLNLTKPEVAILTSDNSVLGYPKGTTLKRIQEAGAKLYSTGTNGTIIIETDGKKYSIISENHQQVQIDVEKDHELHIDTGLTNGKFLGDRVTGKYHHPNCEEAKKIPEENRTWLIDKAQAEINGYYPDDLCKPE